ncbi:MAG: hypothetical protein QOE90_3565 [Thermoplasmata archaeon]|jgi:PAS domain S-box-containing protein|nr:hypothetical protein [Thermoplasmata archaeon]
MADAPRDTLTIALGRTALAVAVLDPEGKFLEANQAYADLIGVPLDRLLGRNSMDFVPEADRARAAATRAEILEKRAWHAENPWTRPDGKRVWLETHASLLPGPPERMLVVALDVSARHEARDQIVALRRQNDLILNAVTEGVLGMDAAGSITFVNEAAARMLGYKPAELIGQERHALIHHSRSQGVPYPEARCPISATLADGSVHHASGEVFWRKDGKPIPVDYTSAPIREEGRLVGVALIFADVSERTQAESVARRANQKILEIYERIPEAFFALDREWRIVYMNPVAEKLRHTPKEAVMGKVLWEAFPDLKGTKFDAEYRRAMQEMTTVQVEEHYPRMGMWFEATAYPSDEGLSIFFRDITLRKRVEQEAKAASIARPLVRKIVQDLVETGGVAHQILQTVGRKLAAENPAPTVGDYLRSYTAMGLGRVEAEKEEGQRYAFTGQDLLEKRPGSRVSTCSFTLGFLSEAVSHVNRDEPTLGTEIECQSRGAPQCRFIVQVKKPEEGLARRVKELV